MSTTDEVEVMVRLVVNADGRCREELLWPEGSHGKLLEGRYTAKLLVRTRESTLAEIAEEVYKTTCDHERVAAAVIAAHEARKLRL